MKTNNSIIIITGGSEGIGYACAKTLLEDGNTICLLSRNEAKLDNAKNSLGLGLKKEHIFSAPTDVTSSSSVANSISLIVEKFGRIDALINCAGCSMTKNVPLEQITETEYQKIMSTNTDGMFNMCKSVLPIFKQQSYGYIINILSVAANNCGSNTAVYSASKYACKAFTESLIEENRKSGIRISSISPGPVATTIWSHKATPPTDYIKSKMLSPYDIADSVKYLLSLPQTVHIKDLEITPWFF